MFLKTLQPTYCQIPRGCCPPSSGNFTKLAAGHRRYAEKADIATWPAGRDVVVQQAELQRQGGHLEEDGGEGEGEEGVPDPGGVLGGDHGCLQGPDGQAHRLI